MGEVGGGGKAAPPTPGIGAPPPGAKPAAAAPGGPPPPTVALAGPVLAGKDKLMADIRKRPFRPEDYTANPPANTDPFHDNLSTFQPRKQIDDKPGTNLLV